MPYIKYLMVHIIGQVLIPWVSLNPEPGCQDTEFQCSNGNCIDSRRTCDGRNDCGDGSDEDSAQCGGVCWMNYHIVTLHHTWNINLVWNMIYTLILKYLLFYWCIIRFNSIATYYHGFNNGKGCSALQRYKSYCVLMATKLFAQQPDQAKKTLKFGISRALWGESISDWWAPLSLVSNAGSLFSLSLCNHATHNLAFIQSPLVGSLSLSVLMATVLTPVASVMVAMIVVTGLMSPLQSAEVCLNLFLDCSEATNYTFCTEIGSEQSHHDKYNFCSNKMRVII